MDKEKTGNLIKESRLKKNYTQTELGNLIGVSNKAISRWENGDSFPDVGVIETLSSVLDIRVQDLITGNVEDNSESILKDFVRIIKLQSKEKKRKVISCILIWIILLCCFISGYTALWRCHMIITVNSIFVYSILMIISYLLLFQVRKSLVENVIEESDRLSKCTKMIPLSSLLFCILITWYMVLSTTKGYNPFGLEIKNIGVFLNGILINIYMINVIVLVIAFYRLIKLNISIHWGIVLSIGSIFISVLYGDMLHRIDYMHTFINNLTIRTLIVLATTGILVGIVKSRFKKVNEKG